MEWDDFSSDDSAEEDLFTDTTRITVNYLIERTHRPRGLKRSPLERDREGANDALFRHYFNPEPVCDAAHFRCRFRMSRQLFMRISNDLAERYPFFQQRLDARGRPGFTTIQKCTTALRQLAYEISSDALDEYLKISEKIMRASLHDFFQDICVDQQCLISNIYMKFMVTKTVSLECSAVLIVCMLVGLCVTPTAWRGQFHRGYHEGPTIILEAAASHDLWIWHAFFGVAGSNNDLNVIEQSPIFDDIIDGVEPQQGFYANGEYFKYGYYLVDGVYNEWSTLVQAFSSQVEDKRKYFTKKQESARKDIERMYRVL